MLESVALPAKQTSLRLPTRLSDADLLWLSAHNDSITFEQTSDGILIMTPPTGSRGNRGEFRLATELVNWNDRMHFGEIRGISGGVLLPEGGQYQADGFVISAAAWEAVPDGQRDDGFPPVLPTAAFELISPANVTATGYTKEFTMKLKDYECSAVALVVLLHPKQEHAVIRRPGHEDEITTAKILTFPELPSLELNAGAIYDDCNRP
jgi:Uma2 family endonuclease